MAQIILSGDGMNIEIEDEIARSDEMLKRALAPHYPDLANAFITREEKDGFLKVTISKRAGPKGYDQESEKGQPGLIVTVLEEAPEYLNPALALAWQLTRLEPFGDGENGTGLSLEERLALQKVISDVTLEGEAEAALIEKTVGFLKTAPAIPANCVPKGF
ncbi:MAG TPA: hypothetical protein VH186_03675 [Chloroflexia bacterium]|nr:hypothetical protein [Chloroflexia bacterium]